MVIFHGYVSLPEGNPIYRGLCPAQKEPAPGSFELTERCFLLRCGLPLLDDSFIGLDRLESPWENAGWPVEKYMRTCGF